MDPLMERCGQVAERSPDPNKQVGCVIANAQGKIICEACNDIPDGLAKHEARCTRPLKYNGLNTPNATPSTPQRAGAFHSKTQLSMSTGGLVSNAAAPSSNPASRTSCRRKSPM